MRLSQSLRNNFSKCQGTLLNRLFSTSFEEMNAKRGRSQTTQGVWVGYAGTDQYKLLVLDVEGTDSRERGEEHGVSIDNWTIVSND